MMPKFTISIPDGKKYVLTVLHEPMTRDMTIEYLPEMKHLGQQLDRPSFLLDVRGAPNLRGTLGDYETYELSKSFGFLGAKIALITDPDDKSYDFASTVSNNAGYRHQLFTDEHEAIDWLDSP
jgi:hypothetical protein